MNKTVFITGATDGIGLETAKMLAADGHTLLIHGRDSGKLASTMSLLRQIRGAAEIESYLADLTSLTEVAEMADAVIAGHPHLDVLINNAGVFMLAGPSIVHGLDVRFLVNTLSPYMLTQRLLSLIPAQGRVVNLSSAAQAPVDLDALSGRGSLSDSDAYAQSKLAITMWSFYLAQKISGDGPVIVAVNPASFLGSKMVKEAYGSHGKDLGIGADILVRAALSEEFAGTSGRYFDNDSGRFAQPHPDALDPFKNEQLVSTMEEVIAELTKREA